VPTPLEAALLGVVQGLTEFLPVSSSAHLILARAFFGWDADKFGLSFDVACHVGTLIAVVIYFRRDLALMLASLSRLFGSATTPGPERWGSGPDAMKHDPGARLAWLLVIGTIPAIIVGLMFSSLVDGLRTPAVAAAMLALGAFGLVFAERVGSKTRDHKSLTTPEAFWLGCAQAAALVPGVSRSGATLIVALLLGLRRAEAARVIFLLAIPAILAAAVHEAPKMLNAGFAGDTASLFLVGVVSSAMVGYVAVKYFIRYLRGHSLAPFAWYRFALALTVAGWLVMGRS
jgi:undecaprenyl-diphosphatase